MADSDQEVFAGLPVVRFTGRQAVDTVGSSVAWELRLDEYDEHHLSLETTDGEFAELLTRFLDTVPPASVRALVVSGWGFAWERLPPIALLCRAADRLTGLRALHIGDTYVCYRRNPTDAVRLLAALPRLEDLSLCGIPDAMDWRRRLRHARLRRLTIKTAGLPGQVTRAVGEADLPALEHLELWLGVHKEYGGTTTVADLAPILSGTRRPRLRYLGLRNAEHADAVAGAVATASVVSRLSVLDLSLGTLGAAGAQALLDGQPLTHLDALDLHHHFLSGPAQTWMRQVFGDRVNLEQPQDPDPVSKDGRYTRIRREEIAVRPTQ